MRLHYDRKRDQYVGKKISIAERRFAAALRLLLNGDVDPETVLESLLDESVWTESEGKTVRPGACPRCGSAMAAKRHRFCGVVCEAGAVVERAWR